MIFAVIMLIMISAFTLAAAASEETQDGMANVTVNLAPGMNLQRIKLTNNQTGKSYEMNWVNDGAVNFIVPEGTYTIYANKGEMEYRKENVELKGTVIHTIPITRLLVRFDGVSSAVATVRVGETVIYSSGWVNNLAEFALFQDENINYILKVDKGGMVHEAVVNCSEETITYSVPLTILTVKYPGIKADKTTVSVGSSTVNTSYWNIDEAVFTLFKGLTYDLNVQTGGMVHTAQVDCNEDEEVYEVPLTKLTVRFPEIKTEKNTISVGSSPVITSYWDVGEAVYILFRGLTYNLKLEKGSMVHEGSILCDEEEEIYDVPVCHVRVLFNGLKASEATIGRNGTDILTYYWKADSVDFYVFQDTGYYVRLNINGKIYSYDNIDCRTDYVEIGMAKVTISYPGVKDVNSV